MYETEFKWQ